MPDYELEKTQSKLLKHKKTVKKQKYHAEAQRAKGGRIHTLKISNIQAVWVYARVS